MNANDLAESVQRALGDAYVVERTLGEGGFAVVFLVRDLSLKRHLAVKVLSPDLITSHTVLERFRREAETVAQLSHPNIVPLHFIGEKDGMLYLAMACVDGGSVADRLERDGAMPIEDARRIISEVASALAHAHKRGVIHRDVKPHNVLLDAESGRALVTDFGIARTGDSSLTMTGMLVGTPAYISPEQVTGEPSDHRADIYALGVMAYEMLAGSLPFEGATPTAMLMKRLGGMPTPLTQRRSDMPALLDAVVTRCLAPDPAERYQNASEVVAALGGSATGTVASTAPRTRSKSGWLAVGAMAVAAVTAGVLLRGRPTAGVAPLAAQAPGKAVTPVINGSLISGMIPMAAGRYLIGSDSDSVSPPRPSSRPAHLVSLAAYRIGRSKVTVAEYRRFHDATEALMPPVASGDSLHAVTGVLWAEAMRYCAWRHPTNGRLPSEEEWEAAVRADGGTKLESAIRDLWEWTSSPVRAYSGAPALPDSMQALRVIRGGAADTPIALATPWFRGAYPPVMRREYLKQTGFRCAVSGSGADR